MLGFIRVYVAVTALVSSSSETDTQSKTQGPRRTFVTVVMVDGSCFSTRRLSPLYAIVTRVPAGSRYRVGWFSKFHVVVVRLPAGGCSICWFPFRS
jgi:hypothetical protein